MNRIIFSLFLSAISFVGCKSKVDDKLEQEIIKTLDENNKMLDESAKGIEEAIDTYKKDPKTAYKAEIRYPEICKANSLLKLFHKELDSALINTSEKDKNLQALFANFKNKILDIDSNAREDLKMLFLGTEVDSNSLKFSRSVTLGLYKNKATILRNIFNKWCYNQIGTVGWTCEFPILLTSQNATHFKTNERLEIVAGIGVYSTRMNPTILIDRKEIKLTPEGYAKYNINVGNKLGKFKKDVNITYKKPDGTLGTSTKEIIYTVD